MSVLDTIPVRVNRDVNSQKAAKNVRFKVGSMRWEIMYSIYHRPNFWTCERFDVMKDWLHQSTSAQLNSLWRARLIVRDPEHTTLTKQGQDEYIYELPDWLRFKWDGGARTLDDVINRNISKINLL